MSNPYPEYKRNTITVPATVVSVSTMQAEINRLVSFNQQLIDEVARLQKREWVGLTDDKVTNILEKCCREHNFANDSAALSLSFARAIEAKLKSKNYD